MDGYPYFIPVTPSLSGALFIAVLNVHQMLEIVKTQKMVYYHILCEIAIRGLDLEKIAFNP